MRRLLTIAASAAVAATAVLATGGLSNAGAAPDADTRSSADANGGTGTTGDPACGGRGLLGRVVHGDVIVGGGQEGGYHPVTIDRGTVTAIDASSISLDRPDGHSITAKLTDATRFRGKTREQVSAGDRVMVVQTNGSARAVVSKPEGSAGCGGRRGAGGRQRPGPARARASVGGAI